MRSQLDFYCCSLSRLTRHAQHICTNKSQCVYVCFFSILAARSYLHLEYLELLYNQIKRKKTYVNIDCLKSMEGPWLCGCAVAARVWRQWSGWESSYKVSSLGNCDLWWLVWCHELCLIMVTHWFMSRRQHPSHHIWIVQGSYVCKIVTGFFVFYVYCLNILSASTTNEIISYCYIVSQKNIVLLICVNIIFHGDLLHCSEVVSLLTV